jgi:hypothetical protein
MKTKITDLSFASLLKVSVLLIANILFFAGTSLAQNCGIAPTAGNVGGVAFYGDGDGNGTSHLRPTVSAPTGNVSSLQGGAGLSLSAGIHNNASTIDINNHGGATDFNTAIALNKFVSFTIITQADVYWSGYQGNVQTGSFTVGYGLWDGTTVTQAGSGNVLNPVLLKANQTYQIRLYFWNIGGTLWIDNPFFSFRGAAVYPAPTLNSTSAFLFCNSSVNLNTITATNTPTSPAGTTLSWHSGSPATAANKITGTGITTPGIYYAAFYDPTTMCYASASTPVTVTGGVCSTDPACGAAPTGANFDGFIFNGDQNTPSGAVRPHLAPFDYTPANFSAVGNIAGGGVVTVTAGIRGSSSSVEINNHGGPTTFAGAIAADKYFSVNVTPAKNMYWSQIRWGGIAGSYNFGFAVYDGTNVISTGTDSNNLTPVLLKAGQTYQLRVYLWNVNGTMAVDNPVFTFKNAALYPAPTLSASTASAPCPATVNLTSINATNTPAAPAGTTLSWHTSLPATAANKISGTGISTSGNYFATFYDPTAMCYSVANSPVIVTIAECLGAGTIDCAKTQIYTAPVVGTPGQKSLIVNINVTTVGCFTPITITGSGVTLAEGTTRICPTTTGPQSFVIPVNYDGSALSTVNFTVGTTGSCAANLTGSVKKALADVWTLDCVPTAAPTLK